MVKIQIIRNLHIPSIGYILTFRLKVGLCDLLQIINS